VAVPVGKDGAVMNGAAVTEQDGNSARPPCYHCGESYTSVNAVRASMREGVTPATR